jgi:hypothetical protein
VSAGRPRHDGEHPFNEESQELVRAGERGEVPGSCDRRELRDGCSDCFREHSRTPSESRCPPRPAPQRVDQVDRIQTQPSEAELTVYGRPVAVASLAGAALIVLHNGDLLLPAEGLRRENRLGRTRAPVQEHQHGLSRPALRMVTKWSMPPAQMYPASLIARPASRSRRALRRRSQGRRASVRGCSWLPPDPGQRHASKSWHSMPERLSQNAAFIMRVHLHGAATHANLLRVDSYKRR